jgi:hypothetical protein
VEMEAAALFAVAKVRGLHVASAFAISDSLADLLWNPQLHGPEVQVGVIPLYEAAVTPCRQLSGTPGHCDWCRCHGTWAGNRRVASCRAGRLQLLARRSCAMRHRKKAYPRHSPASARCTACAPRGMSVRCLRLFRYLDERMFTFDELELGEYRRVELVLRAVAGRRLTFTEVTGHA